MITDSLPRLKSRKDEYFRSDAMREIDLPPVHPLAAQAKELAEALGREDRKAVEKICNDIAKSVASSYGVPVPPVKVLGVRPHKVSDGICVYEKYGDYDLGTTQIRLWLRTAIRQQVSSFGTLLNTLCHELCHHLDVVQLSFPNTYHTRGFYERAALLYHHARETPVRKLFWTEQSSGRYQINWAQTMAKKHAPELAMSK